jgi:hypothetical protein
LRLRGAFGWVFVPVYVAAILLLAVLPRALTSKPTAREIRQQLLAELQPIALANCTLQRIGSPNDGGYLMCGNLLDEVRSAYSYGIGGTDDWGCEISSTRHIPVHQYDCFTPPPVPCGSGRSVFHDECIGARPAVIDARPFDTLERQIARNGDAGKPLVVKIDVEGAELESLMATGTAVLRRIDQLAMELHGTDERYLQLVRKLKRLFHPVHLHFNNQACTVRYKPFPSSAYQVLFVNKRIGIADPASPRPALPNPLDARDYALGRDCQALLDP